jgi:uncharacterized oxidoreductase
MLIAADTLIEFVTALFSSAGATTENAAIVAHHLVDANLKGHDSHGVGMIPHYIHNLRAQSMSPNAEIKVLKDNGAILLIDGCAGFGQVVGTQATQLALERVKDTGIVCVGLRNAHHLGRIGSYGEQCGNAGYVSIHFVNVVGHDPLVSPWGGRERRMSTNPFCCVVPRPGTTPIVLDMATSAIAQGKVRVAHMKGEPVADGALVDSDGLPTTDASVMFEAPFGALGPFGKHKGYGLALMCELLGGALAGHWTARSEGRPSNTIINNMLMLVMDPDAFGNRATFDAEAEAMIEYLHSTHPATGFDKVRVPGEPELESSAARRAEGVPIDDNSWAGILRAAEHAGLSQEQVEQLTASAN